MAMEKAKLSCCGVYSECAGCSRACRAIDGIKMAARSLKGTCDRGVTKKRYEFLLGLMEML